MALAQSCQPDHLQCPGDALLHLRWRQPQAFQPEGDLVLHCHVEELALWILEHQPHLAAHLAGAMISGVHPSYDDLPPERASHEVGQDAIEGQAEGGLPCPGRAHEGQELPLLYPQINPLEHRNRLSSRRQGGVGVVEILHDDQVILWTLDIGYWILDYRSLQSPI